MLEDLRALVEFAHAGSIAGAAYRLFRTPSAITRQVQRLEVALGAELLDRSVKPPRLNPLGVKIVEQARDLLQRAEGLKSLASKDPAAIAQRTDGRPLQPIAGWGARRRGGASAGRQNSAGPACDPHRRNR